ncbi:MAG: phospholipase effector Tle1 domain-containing protein [Hyphomicrobiaceae bacterium]
MASSDGFKGVKIKPVQLGIRKGSIFMPLVLLLMAVLAFMIGRSPEAKRDFLAGILMPGQPLDWYEKDQSKIPAGTKKDTPISIRVLDGPTSLYGFMNAVSKGQLVTICGKDTCPTAIIEACAKVPADQLPCRKPFTVNAKNYEYQELISDRQRVVQVSSVTKDDKFATCDPKPADSSFCQIDFNVAKDGVNRGLSETRDAWSKVVQPFMNLALLQLSGDMKDIVRNVVSTTWQLALFSLIPGLAGLFYRRQFWIWFLATFGALSAINGSGLFGSLTSAAPMPFSGKVLLFLAVQVLILLAIFRLQRHSQGLGALWAPLASISPKWHNRVLKWVLIALGVGGIAHTVTEVFSSGTTSSPHVESLLGGGLLGWLLKWELIFVGLPLIYFLFRNNSTWPSLSNKNIVICLDGTSNTPDQIEMGFIAQTNVYKLFDMLESDDNDKAYEPAKEFGASLCKKYSHTVKQMDGEKRYEQIGFYYAGVGNKFDNNPVLSVLGMGTGMGAGEIVERAYLDLIRVYRPGDRVFITGFSRGAAIARLLARTIDARKSPRSVWSLYIFGKHRMLWMSKMRKEIPITVLGCWDTVGAFGVAKTIFGVNFQSMNMGMDLSVPDNVQQAYHMVALDERRDSFDPTLMDPDPIRPERIVEVWFPGDHANIGGGWATDTLSDVTLDFLLSRISSGYANQQNKTPGDPTWGVYLRAVKADKQDVAVRDLVDGGVPIVDPESSGQIRQWVSRLYEYRPRTLPLHAVISDAVFERMGEVKPAYAPESLSVLNKALAKQRRTVEEGVGEFQETESMEQSEQQAVIEANRRLRLLRADAYATDVKWKIAMRYDIPRALREKKLSGVVRAKVQSHAAAMGGEASTAESIERAIEEVMNSVIVDVVDRIAAPAVVLDNGYFFDKKIRSDIIIPDERRRIIDGAIAAATSDEAIDIAVGKVAGATGLVPKLIEKISQLPATVGAGVVPLSLPMS